MKLKFAALFAIGILPSLGVDAFSSLGDVLGETDYDPEAFIGRDLDEEKRFAPFSPADSDLGDQLILARESGRAKIRLELESHIFWTDNLSNTSFAEQDGFFWLNRADLAWRPRIGSNLFFDSFLEAESYLFDSGRDLDFESYTVGLGLVKIIHDLDDLLLYGRYEYQYLSLGNDSLPTLDTGVGYQRIRVGAHKTFLNLRRHTAFAAADFSFGLDASESLLERDEYSLHLGYTFHATDNLDASFFYRIAQRDFRRLGRDDTLQTTGVELTYALNQHLSFYASALWSDNQSDLPAGFADYESSQIGAGISFTHRF